MLCNIIQLRVFKILVFRFARIRKIILLVVVVKQNASKKKKTFFPFLRMIK